jgi:hypothetical protein
MGLEALHQSLLAKAIADHQVPLSSPCPDLIRALGGTKFPRDSGFVETAIDIHGNAVTQKMADGRVKPGHDGQASRLWQGAADTYRATCIFFRRGARPGSALCLAAARRYDVWGTPG